MPCPNCEKLEERVAWLESELGLAKDATLAALVHRALGVSPHEATVLLALYASEKVLSKWVIAEGLPAVYGGGERDPEIVDVLVHRIRKRLGHDAIETIRTRGYRLSDGGRECIRLIFATDHGARAA